MPEVEKTEDGEKVKLSFRYEEYSLHLSRARDLGVELIRASEKPEHD